MTTTLSSDWVPVKRGAAFARFGSAGTSVPIDSAFCHFADKDSVKEGDPGFVHAAVLALHQLGCPDGWSDEQFDEEVLRVRDVLARQERLFRPFDSASGAPPPSTTKEVASEERRATRVAYPGPLEHALAPAVPRAGEDGLTLRQLDALQSEILKAAEGLRKRGQLFVPFHQQVRFSATEDGALQVETARGAAPPTTAESSVTVVSVDAIGDARSVAVLDRCEWEGDPVTDDFASDGELDSWLLHPGIAHAPGGEPTDEPALREVERVETFQRRRRATNAGGTGGLRRGAGSSVTLLVGDERSAASPAETRRASEGARTPPPSSTPLQADSSNGDVAATVPRRQSSRGSAVAQQQQTLPPLSPTPGKPPLPTALPSRQAEAAAANTARLASLSGIVFRAFNVVAPAITAPPVDAFRAALCDAASPPGVVPLPSMERATAAGGAPRQRRVLVRFAQPRDFVLRFGEAADNDDEDNFYDDAVQQLALDIRDAVDDGDGTFVPPALTPPSTPVDWQPPAAPSAPFRPTPMTLMMIDRLEAGNLDAGPSSSALAGRPIASAADEDDDDDDAPPMPKQTDSAVAEAAAAAQRAVLDKAATEQLAQRREAAAAALRELTVTGGSADASAAASRERLLAAYYAPSRTFNQVPLRPAWLNRSAAPLGGARARGGVRGEALRIMEEDRRSELEAVRPTRLTLQQALRFAPFGALLTALVTFGPLFPADPAQARKLQRGAASGDERDVPLDVAAARFALADVREIEAARLRALAAQRRREQRRREEDVADWSAVEAIAHRIVGAKPRMTKNLTTDETAPHAFSFDESVLLRDAPHFPHFLPRPSSQMSAASPPTALANLRRVPRAVDSRGGLSAEFDTHGRCTRAEGGRAVGGVEPSKRQFVAAVTGRLSGSAGRVHQPPQRPPSRTEQIVATQRAAIAELEATRFAAMHL